MKIVGMIPARMGSYRFPGKPLCDILGMTMIEHCYKRSAMASILDETYVVTCNEEIEKEVKAFGGKVIMTPDTFNRCTDRIVYAVKKNKIKADIIVLIQGDEPLVHPDMINAVTKALVKDKTAVASCMYQKIDSDEAFDDPNEVKLVKTVDDYAIYLSRDGIPSKKLAMKPYDRYKQVCIMPYRRDALLKFINLPQTPLEIVESIDILRIIEHGYKVKLVESKHETYSVDVEADRLKVISVMKKDPLVKKYRR